jgi:hypothetical protein
MSDTPDLSAALRVLRNEIDACNGLNGVYVELHPDVARAILAALDSRPTDLLPEGAIEIDEDDYDRLNEEDGPRAVLEIDAPLTGTSVTETSIRYFHLPAVSE